MDLAQVYLYSRRDVSFNVTKNVRWKVQRLQLDETCNRDTIQKKVEKCKMQKLHSNISTKRNMKHSRKKFKQKIQSSLTQKMLQEIKKIPM